MAVSTASIFIRYAQENAPSLVIAAYRLTLATLVMAPIAFFRHRAELRRLGRGALVWASLSGLFLALHFATWITSLEYTTVASSVVFVTTTPLWVALLAPLMLKESLARPVLMGMLVTLAGGVIIALSDSCSMTIGGLICPPLRQFIGGTAFVGDFLALIGAWAAAGYILIGRRLRAGMSLVVYIFVVYGMAAVSLLALALGAHFLTPTGLDTPLRSNPFWGYPPITYLWFALLALIPQLLGHSTFNWALGYLSAAYVSITLLGEPIGSTILAYFLLGEKPTTVKIIGAILILFGIYTASRRESTRREA